MIINEIKEDEAYGRAICATLYSRLKIKGLDLRNCAECFLDDPYGALLYYKPMIIKEILIAVKNDKRLLVRNILHMFEIAGLEWPELEAINKDWDYD